MKRAFTPKIGSVPSCATDNEGVTLSLKDNSPTLYPELNRRVRTSATTIGLAIAMAAAGMLLPQKHQKVTAAEFGIAKSTEALPTNGNAPADKDTSATTPLNSVPEASNILLARQQKEKPMRGTVVAVGSGKQHIPEIPVPMAAVQQPTPIAVKALASTSDRELSSENKPEAGLEIEERPESSSAEDVVKAPVESIPQTSAKEPDIAATPKVIYQVKSGDTLQEIAASYDTSVTQLAKLNRLDTKAPLETDKDLIVPNSDKSITPDASKSLEEEIDAIDDRVASDSPIGKAKDNELQAEIETLKQGDRVETLVAQAVPEGVQIAVPEPEAVATASPAAPAVPEMSAEDSSAVASADGIEIPVPQPEKVNLSASKLEIQAPTARPKAISTQQRLASPVPIRQVDRLESQPGAIEIPVPKPATNFIPNRSNGGRLATAPLGTDAYNSNIPQSSSQQDLKEQFINPSANVTYGWPVNGTITSGFGQRWGRLHAGIDFGVPTGTPVHASASGIILRSGWVGGYGNLVEIRHPDGSVTRYGHNSQLMMQVGQEVQQGEVIAFSGNTGRSTGPHVHFEIRPDGKQAVNPMPLLPRRA